MPPNTTPLKAQLRRLFQYNAWANTRVLQCLDKVKPEDDHSTALCFRSVHGTMVHIILGSRLWYLRMTGGDTSKYHECWQWDYSKPGDATSPWEVQIDRASLAEEAEKETNNWLALLDSLSEEDLQGTFSYQDTKGNDHTAVRADIMTHIVNHSTHHRGQISAALFQYGQDPVILDMPAYDRTHHHKHQ